MASRSNWICLTVAAGLLLFFAGSRCSIADTTRIPAREVCTSSDTIFVGSCSNVRARLQRGADTVSVWVWPVGTKRYLGYPDWAKCRLPTAVALQLSQNNVLYANIVVRPLSIEKPKHMQFVCIASANHIVVLPKGDGGN